MGKKNSYLIGIILTIVIGTFVHYFICCTSCSTLPKATERVVERSPSKNTTKERTFINPLKIKDPSTNFDITINDNFNFDASSYTFVKPVSANLTNGIKSLSEYLKTHPDKTINITGLYRNDEINTSVFPNLGIARATTVKNYLISMGVASKNTNTFGKQVDNLIIQNSRIVGPLEYSLITSKPNAVAKEDFAVLKAEINANPLILYFKTGESNIGLNENQRYKMVKIVRYLDKVDNATIQIIGHTDNTGKRTTNLKLGQGRADFARHYLINNGIPAHKIKTSSKGPDKPVATNETPQGRAKNRRTVVTIN